MKAQRSFTVRPHLPDGLQALDRLASNLRWSWDRPTRNLFRSIDQRSWDAGGHDPRRVLAEAPTERLQELATDPSFIERVSASEAGLDAYERLPRWFQRLLAEGAVPIGVDGDPVLGVHRIGYFSPEFGISEAVPQYSGGLGVLAGDHLKAASDLGVPLVAVGLFYRHGYFRQSLTVDGWQQERFPDLDPYAMALENCTGTRIELDMAGQPMQVQVWRAMVGRVALYLLDSDLPENPHDLQLVTDRLYGGDVEHRLRQEILLGVGGVRALRALGEPVSVFHTNEGHAGFLGLERIRTSMQEHGLSFSEAIEATRSGAVFTTHTPVPAGIDRFPRELIEKYFSGWAQECGIDVDRLMALGHRPSDPPDERFNMAVMGMRLAASRNGVSSLHGEVSRQMFADLWPGVPEPETPIDHVTNGVHGDTWVATEMREVFETTVGDDWQIAGVGDWQRIEEVGDAHLWTAHQGPKQRLIEHVRRRLHRAGLAAGRSPSELEWVGDALDLDCLTVCFARRMATYKRAALLLSQPDRLRALMGDPERPVQFVFAGKAHPADDKGKELIRELVTFTHDTWARTRFVFVEDYDMSLARSLVQGADVWLNTPVRPMEASGTSGMKAVLNGAIHCSVLDGWWAECFRAAGEETGSVANGWAISTAESVSDEQRRNELEANSLFELLETQIVPDFYGRDDEGVPTSWTRRMKESLRTLGPFVGAHRMVRDYTTLLYLPSAARSDALTADGFGAARALAAYRIRLSEHWQRVRVESVDTDESIGDLGGSRPVRVMVSLGALRPDEVEVQMVVGRVGQSGELEDPAVMTIAVESDLGDGRHLYSGTATLEVAGRMGVTARVVPRHELLGNPVDLGFVAWAGNGAA
jgi:starch phosphorylase